MCQGLGNSAFMALANGPPPGRERAHRGSNALPCARLLPVPLPFQCSRPLSLRGAVDCCVCGVHGHVCAACVARVSEFFVCVWCHALCVLGVGLGFACGAALGLGFACLGFLFVCVCVVCGVGCE